jgi:hypothetical protein
MTAPGGSCAALKASRTWCRFFPELLGLGIKIPKNGNSATKHQKSSEQFRTYIYIIIYMYIRIFRYHVILCNYMYIYIYTSVYIYHLNKKTAVTCRTWKWHLFKEHRGVLEVRYCLSLPSLSLVALPPQEATCWNHSALWIGTRIARNDKDIVSNDEHEIA